MNADMRSKHRDGWRLFEELELVTWAGPVLVEDLEPFGLVVVPELPEPEDGKFVDTPAEVAEDLAATEGVGVLVLIGIGEVFVLADAWLVTTTFVVGVAAVVWALAITTLVDETGSGITVAVLVLVDAAISDCGASALQKLINCANCGST